MTAEAIKAYILENFNGINLTEAGGDLFFMHWSNDKLPFATLITKDNEYDSVSNLDREGFFRLNFPLSREIFVSMFGVLTDKKGLEAYMDSGIDFTQENTILPHPTYGSMYWVCVVNPSRETFETIKQHLRTSFDKITKAETEKNDAGIQ